MYYRPSGVFRKSISIIGFGIGLVKMSSISKFNVVFVLGPPGSGKGTQCSKIVQKFGYLHLSAGDLLRAERSKPGSQYGEMIEEYIRDGRIVPVEVTCSLLERAMKESGKRNFLIDGFPRNEDNLQGWNKQCNEIVNLQFVIFFDCDQKTCTDRILARGAAGSGRVDDNVESLKKRFVTYMNSTMPIINHYESLNLVRKIDASHTPEDIFENVQALFA